MKAKNLLFIVADEYARPYSGCYEHPVVKTPNIDRFASNGTRFTNAYTPCPDCVPARASLATGQWVHQNGCFSSFEAFEGGPHSWMHHLNETGHSVVSFGKLGFRESTPANGFTREFLPIHNMNGVGWVKGLLRKPLVNGTDSFEVREFANQIGVGESEYTKYDRVVCDTACAWLQAHGRRHDKPWVMFTSFISPHYPLVAPREFYDLYDDASVGLPHKMNAISEHPVVRELQRFFNYADYIDEDLTRTGRRAYFALCSFLDYLLGTLVGELEKQNLIDDTRIIFTSDHGEMLGNQGLWTKMVMNEDSIAVPMIISGDGVPSGMVVDTPVSLVDCYQTVMECVDEELTEQERSLPGTSLYQIANGEESDRCVISEYHDGGVSSGLFALRKGHWKFNYYPGHPPQLFDLSIDPQEDNDLASNLKFEHILEECELALRNICDPDAVEALVHEKQAAIIEELGGYDTVASMDEADIFIELGALYVNSTDLRKPPDRIVNDLVIQQ